LTNGYPNKNKKNNKKNNNKVKSKPLELRSRVKKLSNLCPIKFPVWGPIKNFFNNRLKIF
jgi:hypothetical protein